jgi:hypothetical protein
MNIVVFLISIIKLLIFAISSPYIIVKWFFCLHLYIPIYITLLIQSFEQYSKINWETILQNCTLIIVKKTIKKMRTNFDKKKNNPLLFCHENFIVVLKVVVFLSFDVSYFCNSCFSTKLYFLTFKFMNVERREEKSYWIATFWLPKILIFVLISLSFQEGFNGGSVFL